MLSSLYFVTAGSGEKFITEEMQYAVKSLLRTGVSPDSVYVVVNAKNDRKLIRTLIPEISNLSVLDENLDYYKWRYMGGKRKYAVLKSASIHKIFPNPIEDSGLVLFDGDVLWYSNPTEFLLSKSDKTWFHHGKGLDKRAKISKEKVDIRSFDSVSKWCRKALAYLLVEYGVESLPDREVCSGFYLLHPKDHKSLPKASYEGCRMIADKFIKDDSAGEQCPLNAALCKLNTDWHGGSRFFCPDHIKYFEHFFGDIEWKKRFQQKLKQLELT